MGTSLSGLTPATTFDALIKVGDNSALSASLKTISDGEGNDSPLKLSTSAVGIGSITNVETEINGKQATLVSGTSIKTINSTSLLGSGDVAVQETLVSGTNIKTINSTSLLGSGDISISASPAGSDSQIQFNDSGAFGADSLFNWDNTNKRLGVGETTPTARVDIKGEGNSATTVALLVQNSDGTSMFRIKDSGYIDINPTNRSGGTVQFRGDGTDNLLKVNANDNYVAVGANPPSGTRFFVKGRGATSATTALLVENSAGTDLIKVVDNGQVLLDVQSAEASAKVQIDSTTQGFLPPRMTTTQRDAMEPAAGLVIYDSTTNNLQCYDGTSWNNLF